MKTKEIKEVRQIPKTPEDYDREELRIKENEIENREETLERNKEEFNLRKRQLELGKREAEIRREEYEIIMKNPLGYKETEEWAEHVKKWASFEIDRVDQSINDAERAFEIIQSKLDTQNERCNGDLKELDKRVKQLQKKLKIKPTKK